MIPTSNIQQCSTFIHQTQQYSYHILVILPPHFSSMEQMFNVQCTTSVQWSHANGDIQQRYSVLTDIAASLLLTVYKQARDRVNARIH